MDTGIFVVIFSAFEYFAFLNRRSLSRKKKEPGDFGMDPFNLYESRGSSPQAKKSLRESEIWSVFSSVDLSNCAASFRLYCTVMYILILFSLMTYVSHVRNGRIAMMALLVYYLEEKLTQESLVDVSAVFFQPLWVTFPFTGH